ncbi:MAG TPA: NAD(P)-dependent oxidoreductase [Acidimicrobiales bacterium]|nr:NAD(P)-dependent oxidoreductase [Acidimicrobiales bacterium]
MTPAQGITAYGCVEDEAALFRELAPRLGVAVRVTEEPPSVANAELAAGNRCISVSHRSPIDDAALLALRRAGVGFLSTRSIGQNHLDVAYAERIGITVGNVAYSPDSVADYTLMLMLMALRDAKSLLRRADLHDYALRDRPGRELRDLTVGVIGTGRIGSAVIARLRGFGCRVLAHDTLPGADATYVALEALLSQSDVVTLHVPLDPSTRHLLDGDRIAQLKPGAIVVNTSRGGLVDTAALVDALDCGHLGGAALDVIEGEQGAFHVDGPGGGGQVRDAGGVPRGRDLVARLQAMPNVVVSPHTAYRTDHALRDMVEHSIVSCLNFGIGDAAWLA